MSQAPLTFLEKKWASGWRANQLFQAAIQTSDRKSIPYLDYDIHKSVTWYGRRTMMNVGRWLFANFSQVRGAIHEQAELSSSSYIPQFYGDDEVWGDLAESWMMNHDEVCDVAGPPYTMRMYRKLLITSVLRDGDMGTILTQTANGYPMIQCIPAHRIGSRIDQVLVEGGPFDGARIIDGVIVDDYSRPLAYRVFGENPWEVDKFQDVSANDMFLSFVPEYVGQVRGFSNIGSSIYDFQDVKEARQFELLAQKVAAGIALIEENEKGEAPPGIGALSRPTSGTNTSGTATGLISEVMDGGVVRYFKAKSGSKLTAHQHDRPTANQQAFEDKIIRSSFHGINWSVDFSLDPTKAGGAQMRIIIDKINRSIQENQDLILLPAAKRINGYRLSKAIKLSILPNNSDWWKFTYTGPAKLTADEKYASDVSVQEHEAGLTTLEKECAKRNEYWEDVIKQSVKERALLEKECKAAGIDPNNVVRFKLNSPPAPSTQSTEETIAP